MDLSEKERALVKACRENSKQDPGLIPAMVFYGVMGTLVPGCIVFLVLFLHPGFGIRMSLSDLLANFLPILFVLLIIVQQLIAEKRHLKLCKLVAKLAEAPEKQPDTIATGRNM